MKRLAVHLVWLPGDAPLVGHIAENNRRIYFEYDRAFVDLGVQLSPFKLPLQTGLIEHTDRAFGPLPGLFDDSLPDGWGLLLMNRAFRRRGIDPASLSVLDRLAWVGTRTMGALTYHPPLDVEHHQGLLDLHELGKNAEAVVRGDAVHVLPELIRAGGSPAGARPKVLVGLRGDEVISGESDLPDGFEHWIMKFSANGDARDTGPLEYAYAQMATAAGIGMPPTRLISVTKSQKYFAARRFDRPSGNRRLHMHTFANLMHADFRVPSTDYADLLRLTSALTRNHADVVELFRRMVFNVAAHNRDDHAKNFSFLMNAAGEWSLSPAYDVIYSTGPGGEHTMVVAGEGNAPRRAHILKLAEQADLKPAIAEEIINDVNRAIARWGEFAAQSGCTRKTARKVTAALRPI